MATEFQKHRKQKAIIQFENQLSSGVKTAKKTGEKLQLTEIDRNRINKQIDNTKANM